MSDDNTLLTLSRQIIRDTTMATTNDLLSRTSYTNRPSLRPSAVPTSAHVIFVTSWTGTLSVLATTRYAKLPLKAGAQVVDR